MRSTEASPPTTRTVTSADGTTIAYRRTGHGPALVVVPGNNRMAHNYDRLAAELADAHTVCIIERRGRGGSGPQGAAYGLDREIDDLLAVARAEDARLVFGHSYGGLVALSSALARHPFDRLAVYEPAISLNGSFDLSFREEFRRLLARGKHVRALALFFHRTRLIPLPRTPYAVCWALSWLMAGHPSEVRDLMPTTAPELDVVAGADSDGSRYASVSAETLLIGGTRAPAYLTGVLDPLARIVPDARHVTLDGADHNAPDESAPARVAGALRAFLA
ncbi:alpha/beta hydrolase [Galbitalea sp. SE-J8]|uniref:alpha/beta fold hydrolase n=1 Tax=Galbitalea sp. SE-J8 TaxID=3054952 RepID=UPI00259CDF9F|nr:alpha/beta hydrolase [Galbitalea sp. SE-J8]MDM4763994.1 alpha/beta hydrolase [Galbitalea sp. SE-J8]